MWVRVALESIEFVSSLSLSVSPSFSFSSFLSVFLLFQFHPLRPFYIYHPSLNFLPLHSSSSFFFCSSLKSDFNGSCRGYYTSSVILLREIFIRRKEGRGRGLDEGRLTSIREARSPRRFLLTVFINSYVCLIVFSRIISPYYFLLDNNNNWNALTVANA